MCSKGAFPFARFSSAPFATVLVAAALTDPAAGERRVSGWRGEHAVWNASTFPELDGPLDVGHTRVAVCLV